MFNIIPGNSIGMDTAVIIVMLAHDGLEIIISRCRNPAGDRQGNVSISGSPNGFAEVMLRVFFIRKVSRWTV